MVRLRPNLLDGFIECRKLSARIGVWVGANANVIEDFAAISRLGHSLADIDKISECFGAPACHACTPRASKGDDDDSKLDGVGVSIGARYTF
jgi:hypothetical protein